MEYPEDFKKEIREIYFDFDELLERLEDGDYFLGRYLDDSSKNCVSIDTILNAKTLKEIKEIAEFEQRKINAYLWWLKIVNKT